MTAERESGKSYVPDKQHRISKLTRYTRELGVYDSVFKLMGVLIGS